MAAYKTVKGFNIQTLSSDPSNLEAGDVWYNSTSNDLKGYGALAGAWASSPNMPAGHGLSAQIGTTTAGIVIAGNFPPDQYTNTTIEWNGSSWTAGGTITRSPASGTSGQLGFGTQTTATIAGGHQSTPLVSFPTLVEEYNGTSWTAVNAMTNGRNDGSAAGTNAAGLVFCGTTPGGTGTTTEEYDGTNWTAGGAINSGRPRTMGTSCGTQTAALCIGGESGPDTAVEEYNGTGWTEVEDVPTSSWNGGCAGIQTEALSFGGGPAPSATGATFSYNGSTWSAESAMATGRNYIGALGTGTSAMMCGGGYPFTGPTKLLVEEWTSGDSVVTFTDS